MQHSPFPRQDICIRRHCMQQLLHDAIYALSNKQGSCQGLFSGGGNMIEKHASVTNLEHPSQKVTDFCGQQGWIGVYLTAHQQPDSATIQSLSELVQRYGNSFPACYLLLESNQKGRVEARLFADAACLEAMPLALQEDGVLYQSVENR